MSSLASYRKKLPDTLPGKHEFNIERSRSFVIGFPPDGPAREVYFGEEIGQMVTVVKIALSVSHTSLITVEGYKK